MTTRYKKKLFQLITTSLASAVVVNLSPGIALSSRAQVLEPSQNPVPPAQQNSADAINQSGFICDTSGDVPTTVFLGSQGNPEPWIEWVSEHFSDSGWSPDARCQEVSSRLENYRRNNTLEYVTIGRINNQSVICVASKDQGPCQGIVYTLKPGQDEIEALNNLFAWRQGTEANLQPNQESAGAIPYINVGKKLESEEAKPQSQPPSQPTQKKTFPSKTIRDRQP